jgi:hypothetical protein
MLALMQNFAMQPNITMASNKTKFAGFCYSASSAKTQKLPPQLMPYYSL